MGGPPLVDEIDERVYDSGPQRDPVIPARGSGDLRSNLERIGSARCLSCGWTRSGSWAMIRDNDVVRTSGHAVLVHYASQGSVPLGHAFRSRGGAVKTKPWPQIHVILSALETKGLRPTTVNNVRWITQCPCHADEDTSSHLLTVAVRPKQEALLAGTVSARRQRYCDRRSPPRPARLKARLTSRAVGHAGRPDTALSQSSVPAQS